MMMRGSNGRGDYGVAGWPGIAILQVGTTATELNELVHRLVSPTSLLPPPSILLTSLSAHHSPIILLPSFTSDRRAAAAAAAAHQVKNACYAAVYTVSPCASLLPLSHISAHAAHPELLTVGRRHCSCSSPFSHISTHAAHPELLTRVGRRRAL